MPLVEIKHFDALINNIPLFDQQVKIKQEATEKKCQEMMTIQLFVSLEIL